MSRHPGRAGWGIVALTDQEIGLMQLLAEGLTDQQIARRCGLSINTIKSHLKHAYAALGVDCRIGAITIAMRRGLIPCPCQHTEERRDH